MNSNLKKLVYTLEGSKDKGKTLPPPQILKYDIKWDAFEILPKHSPAIDPTLKTLFLIHGTFTRTTLWMFEGTNEPVPPENQHLGSFGELLERTEGGQSFLKDWMIHTGKYQQVIAFDHYTVIEDIRQNAEQLMNLLPDQKADGTPFSFEQEVDIVTGSRGGLLGQYLANNFGKKVNPKIPIGNGVIIASPNRGSGLLEFDHLSKKKKEKKRYKKALKEIINSLSIGSWPKFLLKTIVSFNGGMIVEFMKLPGIKMQRPNSELIREVQSGKPAPVSMKPTGSKPTLYLPIIGKYDGSEEDQHYMGEELEELIKMLKEKYAEFGIFIFKIFKLKAKWILPIKSFEKSVRTILTTDIEPVVQRKIFRNQSSDLVISSEGAYALPSDHYVECFVQNEYHKHLSVAIHSYYFNEFFKPQVFGEKLPVKEIVKRWLEDPTISCELARDTPPIST